MVAEVQEAPAPVDLMLAKIDEFLASISHQRIVAQADVVNFTLDLRQIIKEKK
jgi:hypothetical protein